MPTHRLDNCSARRQGARHTLLLLAVAAAVAVLSACGGGGDDPNSTATPGAPSAATSAPAQTPAAGEECTPGGPPNLSSTSHEINVATTEQVIDMEWDITDVSVFEYAFSQDPSEPPDELTLVPIDASGATSGPLGQNRWYFYLIPRDDGIEADIVRCGPYVIERDASGDGGASGGGIGDIVTLTIAVEGGSSVEYFNTAGERLICGDTTLSGHDVTCSGDFVRGSEARIQRTLGLSDEEEARWRLSGWGGACEGIDAEVEPRGGQCILTMDDEKAVTVSFEQRAMITVTHTGPSQLLLRWGIDYQPAAQKGGGNPLTLRGQFDCDTDTLAACTKTAYFDKGTTAILTAGSGVDAANFASWSGACSGTDSTCEVVLESDVEVGFNWEY